MTTPPASDRSFQSDTRVLRETAAGVWTLTGYDDVRAAAASPGTFSSEPPGPGELLVGAHGGSAVLGSVDPPAHTRYRRLLTPVFAPAQVALWEPELRAVTGELVEAMLARGEVDFVAAFALPLPGATMAAVLGLDPADRRRLPGWLDGLADPAELRDRVTEAVAERRSRPGPDLLSRLVEARAAGEAPLTTQEILELVGALLVAGRETTAAWLAGTLRLLLAHPESLRAVRQQPERIPGMLEESLRLTSPARSSSRTVRDQEVELAGVRLPAGAELRLGWHAANRDERHFAMPEAFVLDRPDTGGHLAFGHGIHHCLGAHLARAQARIAFEELLARATELRAAVSGPQDPARILAPLPIVCAGGR